MTSETSRASPAGGKLRLEPFTRKLRRGVLNDGDLDSLDGVLERLSAFEIVRWAWTTFGLQAVVSSSFQTQSLPLLHIVSRTAPEMRIVFLDTGFHFQETLSFRDRMQRELGLRVEDATPRLGHRSFRDRHGELYRSDPDLCCYLNKIEPMKRCLRGSQAWIAGIRRDQTAHRRKVPILSIWRPGLFKICPLATWTASDVEDYRREHGLPQHPLDGLGYRSIGCAPCTHPVRGSENERDGRWSGDARTECGLHLGDERGQGAR